MLTVHNHLFSSKCPEILLWEDPAHDLTWDRPCKELLSATSGQQHWCHPLRRRSFNTIHIMYNINIIQLNKACPALKSDSKLLKAEVHFWIEWSSHLWTTESYYCVKVTGHLYYLLHEIKYIKYLILYNYY